MMVRGRLIRRRYSTSLTDDMFRRSLAQGDRPVRRLSDVSQPFGAGLTVRLAGLRGDASYRQASRCGTHND